jgi:hypothetical protein
MKLPVIQIILGILVVCLSVFTIVWYFPFLVPEIPAEITSEAEGSIVEIKTAEINHYNNHWFAISAWMIIVILLGLLVGGTGIIQLRKQKAGAAGMKLAIIQTVSGVFLISISLLTPVWYEPILFPNKLTLPNGLHSMGSYSIQYMRVYIVWFISLLFTGLVIFSCGIAQILQSRKQMSVNINKIEDKDVIRMERI